MNPSTSFVTEPQKRVPVVRDVDVVVAGAGCAGVFAALAAAADGARTILVERTGMLGGNAGPGMLFGCTDPMSEGPSHLPGGNTGIVRTVEERMNAAAGGRAWNRCFSASVFSETVARMMDEHGVELVMPAYAADPMLVDGRVAGLFVETKSGRVALGARTVVDATAEADIAMRAGAPMIRHVRADPAHKPAILDRYETDMNPGWSEANWNEVGLMYVVAGIDWTAYREFLGSAEPVRFKGLMPDAAGRPHPRVIPKEFKFPGSLYPKLRAAWQTGEFRHARELRDGSLLYWQFRMIRLGADTAEDAIAIHGDIDVDDWKDVAVAEHEMRMLACDAVQFMRRHAPGFENAWVLATSPFIGARGGPCIEGEAVIRAARYHRGPSAARRRPAGDLGNAASSRAGRCRRTGTLGLRPPLPDDGAQGARRDPGRGSGFFLYPSGPRSGHARQDRAVPPRRGGGRRGRARGARPAPACAPSTSRRSSGSSSSAACSWASRTGCVNWGSRGRADPRPAGVRYESQVRRSGPA